MVKFVQCVTRAPGMPAIEFRNRWNDYGKRIEAMVRQRPNVLGFRLSTTLLVKETVSFMMEYGSAAPFDGMVEIWLDDATITAANLQHNREAKAWMAEMAALLREFVDKDKTTTFYAAEEMVFERESTLHRGA